MTSGHSAGDESVIVRLLETGETSVCLPETVLAAFAGSFVTAGLKALCRREYRPELVSAWRRRS